MFCKTCGNSMADDAKFCGVCGTSVVPEAAPAPAAAPAQPVAPAQPMYSQPAQPVYQQPAQPVYGQPAQPMYQQPYPPMQPKAPNPMIQKFVDTIKNFWVNPIGTVGTAAKSNTHEWAILAGIAVLTFAIGSAVAGLLLFKQLFSSLLGGMMSGMGSMMGGLGSSVMGSMDFGSMLNIGKMFPFLGALGIGLLIGAATFFGTAAGLWLLVSKVFKKETNFIAAMNMVATASLPLAVIHLLNMLIGLIYAPLTFIFFLIALFMTILCLYAGTQKLDKLDKSPLYGFIAVIAVVMIVACLIGLLYNVAFSANMASVMSNPMSLLNMNGLGGMMGGYGDLGDLGSLF